MKKNVLLCETQPYFKILQIQGTKGNIMGRTGKRTSEQNRKIKLTILLTLLTRYIAEGIDCGHFGYLYACECALPGSPAAWPHACSPSRGTWTGPILSSWKRQSSRTCPGPGPPHPSRPSNRRVWNTPPALKKQTNNWHQFHFYFSFFLYDFHKALRKL